MAIKLPLMKRNLWQQETMLPNNLLHTRTMLTGIKSEHFAPRGMLAHLFIPRCIYSPHAAFKAYILKIEENTTSYIAFWRHLRRAQWQSTSLIQAQHLKSTYKMDYRKTLRNQAPKTVKTRKRDITQPHHGHIEVRRIWWKKHDRQRRLQLVHQAHQTILHYWHATKGNTLTSNDIPTISKETAIHCQEVHGNTQTSAPEHWIRHWRIVKDQTDLQTGLCLLTSLQCSNSEDTTSNTDQGWRGTNIEAYRRSTPHCILWSWHTCRLQQVHSHGKWTNGNTRKIVTQLQQELNDLQGVR